MEVLETPAQEELAKTFFASSTKKEKEKRAASKASKRLWLIIEVALVLGLLFGITRSRVNAGFFFTRGGRLNGRVISEASFLGDAGESSKKDDMLVLVNAKGSGWANLSMELKEPMDMEKLNVSYLAKGEVGNENLILVLVDADNKSYRMPRDSSPTFTKEWQRYTVDLAPVRDAIDISRISAIRFEFGGLTAGNYPTATIFLKDIRAVKTGGAKRL